MMSFRRFLLIVAALEAVFAVIDLAFDKTLLGGAMMLCAFGVFTVSRLWPA